MRSPNWIEAIGLVAVVVSLVFVGIELRQNTAATESQALLDLNLSVNEVFLVQAEEGELSDIVIRGHLKPDELSPVEYFRYERAMLSILNVIEAALAFHENGLIDDDQFQGWKNVTCAQLNQPGTKYVWDRNRSAFSRMLNDVVTTDCEI